MMTSPYPPPRRQLKYTSGRRRKQICQKRSLWWLICLLSIGGLICNNYFFAPWNNKDYGLEEEFNETYALQNQERIEKGIHLLLDDSILEDDADDDSPMEETIQEEEPIEEMIEERQPTYNATANPELDKFPISMIRSLSEPMEDSDIPLFLHVPKSGGSTIKSMFAKCFRFGKPLKIMHDNETIAQSYQSNLTAENSGKVPQSLSKKPNVIASARFHDSLLLFNDNHRARMFTMLRDPIDRATSLFYYLKYAHWEKKHFLFKNLTLNQYLHGNYAENNWLTRWLTNEITGPLNHTHVALATDILAEKCLIGLMDRYDESMRRFVAFFGWEQGQRGKNCIKRMLRAPRNKGTHKKQILQGSKEWEMLLSLNEFDMILYENAKKLFRIQRRTIPALNTTISTAKQ